MTRKEAQMPMRCKKARVSWSPIDAVIVAQQRQYRLLFKLFPKSREVVPAQPAFRKLDRRADACRPARKRQTASRRDSFEERALSPSKSEELSADSKEFAHGAAEDGGSICVAQARGSHDVIHRCVGPRIRIVSAQADVVGANHRN
jgi:hypothetical protein